MNHEFDRKTKTANMESETSKSKINREFDSKHVKAKPAKLIKDRR